MTPKGIIARKVRASQGRITDNISRGRPPEKGNRNRPPSDRKVRMERRGKSSPISMVTWICCKLYSMQHRMRRKRVCPTLERLIGWHMARAMKRSRQRGAQIDGRRSDSVGGTEPGLQAKLTNCGCPDQGHPQLVFYGTFFAFSITCPTASPNRSPNSIISSES